MAGWTDDTQLAEVTEMLGSGAFITADPSHGLGFSEATPAEVPSWWSDGPSFDDEREIG